MTAPWLSADWVAVTAGPVGEALATVTRPGTTTVGLTVTGLPGGEVRYHRVVAAGRVTDGDLGPAPAPDVSFTMTADDGRAMVRGTLDPSVAFMQGRFKTAGDAGLVLAVLAGWATPAGRAARRHLDTMTEM